MPKWKPACAGSPNWGYPARLIDPAEAAEIEPALRFPEPGGAVAWFPGEGYVLTEPLIARLVARAAGQRRGCPAPASRDA